MTRKPFYFIMLGGLVLFLVLTFIFGTDQPDQVAHEGEGGDSEAVEFDAAGAYAASCSSCHGAELEGAFGPTLVGLSYSPDEIVEIMTNGKGQMPPGVFQGTDEEKAALAAWILEHQ